MNLDFFAVLSNLISLFALIAVGYFAVRSKIIGLDAVPVFSALLMKITVPCTIFILLAKREYDPAFIHDGITLIIAGTAAYAVMLYSSRWLGKVIGVPENCRGVWAFSCAFNNGGFMGFPITLALFGADGLALAVMLNVALNITMYTIGALEICRDNPEQKSGALDVKAIIFSGINFATVLSLIFYFSGVKVPEVLEAPITYLSNITTPLSMIIIGMALARNKGLELFADKNIWASAVLKLIVLPAVLSVIVKFFPLGSSPLVNAVFVLIMAMPAASVTAVLCEMYHGNVIFAAELMFIHNLLCVVSIPLVCMMLL